MNCTFSGNAGSSGGAIDVTNNGSLTLTNCTLSGNSARNGTGSGVSVAGSFASTDSIIQNRGSNIYVFPAQYHYMTSRVIYIPGGSFQSGGHNLFSDTPAAALDPTDLVNTDPLLGPLADNGGLTLTQALLPGSPAIDAGTAVPGVTTDQRGVPRPQGNASDIGAFELEVPHTGFYALSEPSIAYSTATVTLSGNIQFGKQIPTGKVVITLNNVAQSVPIDAFRGHFSAVFAASGLHVSSAPYTVTYRYAGQGDWPAATATEPLMVTPVPLTIVANDTNVHFGSTPTLTATYSRFVNGDAVSSLTRPVTLSSSAAAYSPPGRYEITATGAASPDYAITFVNGWLTVTQPKTRYERSCVAIVTTLYQDVLGRAAESKGLHFWMDRMKAGARVVNITRRIWTSAEHRTLVQNHTATKITLRTALKDALSAGRKAARYKA
jgi:hypothetical protein